MIRNSSGSTSLIGKTELSRSLCVLLLFLLAVLHVSAQTDPDPNSSSPVLLRASDSTLLERGGSLDPTGSLILYVTNVQLMKGEGRTAFRVYAEDTLRRLYRFPVMELAATDKRRSVFAIKVELRDEIGYWEDPPHGDLSISVAWRGLESNRLNVSVGNAPLSPAESKRKTVAVSDPSDRIGYFWSGDRIRFLEQATFGPTHSLDLRLRRIGLRAWLNEQFEIPYPSAGTPYPNFPGRPTTLPTNCNGQIDDGLPDPDPFCFVNHYTMYPVQNWFYREAFYGDAQLRHRVAWALGQIWVVSSVGLQQSSHMVQYHKVLSRNAFGNWRTLMRDMTLNAAMGDFLDMRESSKFFPNENYAREVLQLFNIGLVMLNQDGTVKLDAQNNPIPTYDQTTVNNFTVLLTGWNLCEASLTLCPNRTPGSPNFVDPMMITNVVNHNLAAKTLLDYPGSTTTNVPACDGCTGDAIRTYADNSLNQALDNIYNHPNVAPFVSKFLIQQLVTGDPTPAYVGRISAVFNANRTNPRQLREVITAILLDPEARGDIKTEPRYGKLREPVQLVTSLARQFDVRSFDRAAQSDGVLTFETSPTSQIAFTAPSVFNFYPPDYIVPGRSFNGPEFAIYTTSTAIARLNLVNTLIFNGVPLNAERHVTQGTSLGFSELESVAASDPTGNQMMDLLNARMLHGTMSPQMRSTILNAVLTVPESNPLLRAKRAAYLVATSSQYQVQR
jgi:uncharacterized protein (DUF1800 family)